MRTFSSSRSVREFRCRDWRGRFPGRDGIADRQTRLAGFDQDALARTTCAVIGVGGIGGEFVRGAVRKGIGRLLLYDGDEVEPSNLNRQFFTPRDVGKNKAVRLARNASGAGFMGTRLTAVPYFFQAAVERGLVWPCDVVFCGVDNDETRVFVARRFLDKPVILCAVSRDAGHGHVIVQEPGKACFGCMMPQALGPEAVERGDGACPGVPAVVDVLGVVAMLSLYALDSVLMARPRKWNFKTVTLHGLAPEINARMPRREGCPVCGE